MPSACTSMGAFLQAPADLSLSKPTHMGRGTGRDAAWCGMFTRLAKCVPIHTGMSSLWQAGRHTGMLTRAEAGDRAKPLH